MAVNVKQEYNVLNDCLYIRNRDGCMNDTNTGYEIFFNQGLGGWTDYSGMEVMHTDGYFLWGITNSSSCYIAREDDFTETFEADYFGEFEVDMLIRLDTDDAPDTFTSRIRWKMTTDVGSWPVDAYMDFTVQADGIWHRYSVILLEHQLWVGDCNNFQFFPVIDGVENIEILIKRFAFKSDVNYKCKQPACAGHRGYSHPCPYIGTYARAYSTTRRSSIDISDSKSKLGVSIDGYPAQYIDIDLSHANDPYTVAQAITMKLNVLGIGGYKFAECRYDPIAQSFSIYSGTRGKNGSVVIYPGPTKDVTQELGFYDDYGNRAWRQEKGVDPVDGFVEKFYRLPATLLYRLPSATTTVIDFDPKDPLVQIGRRDLRKIPMETFFPEGYMAGHLMIDIFGKCTYEGKLNQLRYRGELASSTVAGMESRIYLLRPEGDTSYTTIAYTTINSSHLKKGLYITSVDWDARPGDVLALWQCMPVVHGADSEDFEKLYKYSWIEKRLPYLDVGDKITYTKKDVKFYGFESLPVYGESTQRMLDIGIEAELKYEYGVSHVAVIGDPDSSALPVKLTDLSSTQVTVKTPEQTIGPVSVDDADYRVDSEITDDYFYITFWFPGIMKNVLQTNMYFPEDANLRAFCWEWYVEPDDRVGFAWGGTEPGIETNAPIYGSETGWRRMPHPAVVFLDDTRDFSYDLYLGWNYVTDDTTDYYPGLTEEEMEERRISASNTYWNKLQQTWGGTGIHTRGLRLNCWGAINANIDDIEIYSAFLTTRSLLHSIEAVGISGPEVFDTERYDVINIYGDKYRSSNISRAQTEDYIYSLEFSLQDENNTAIAPVGTTMSKLRIEIGSLKCKIEQIKIIPQKLAVQVKAEGDEPVEEIKNLSWGMPSDGSEWTYGPVKEYQVCNDRGVEARLLLGVANPLAVNQACIFYSQLSSYEALTDPIRGHTAQLMSSDDYLYTNDRGINYRSIVYSILPSEPVNWYSSTSSGAVWQTLVSGNPFTDTTRWSEPNNPYQTSWSVFNWAKSDDVSISGGNLNIAVDSRVLDVDGQEWRNPTYFQDLNKSQYMLIETKVEGEITKHDHVDASAGIVLFDNEDRTKFIRVERYTGNNITTSGYTAYSIPHGDYVSYGQASQYQEHGGFAVIDVGTEKTSDLLLRMAKEQNRVEIGYRLPWGSWTTVSSFDITGWSDNLRMGLFVGATDRLRDSSDATVRASFNYLAYKKSTNRITDFFDYTHDFEDYVYTDGTWTAHNPNKAEVLKTSPDGIHIINYLDGQTTTVFDTQFNTPAMETEWGGVRDQGILKFNVNTFNEGTLTSGNFSAGVLLSDTSDSGNYLKFSMVKTSKLAVETSTGIHYVNLDSAITSASGVWLKVDKSTGILVPSYSFDGAEFTAISGYRLSNWSSDAAISMVFSTDLPEIKFTNMEIGTSQLGANAMAAEFDPALPLYNIWGRQSEWQDVMYTSSDTLDSWTVEKPDACRYIRFSKNTNQILDTNSVVFIQDVWKAKQLGYDNVTYEVDAATEMLFDRSTKVRQEVTQTTSSGSWPNASASMKGMPQYDYPVLIVDFGRTYEVGRSALAADNAKGKFSRSVTGIVTDVYWDTSLENLSGFDRKCLLSSSNQCTADPDHGKPIMTYTDGEVIKKYYAGPCDGVQTDAGPTYRACPLYSLGRARWMMVEWNDYITTSVSGGSVWFFAPIHAHPLGRPYSLTDYDPWWVTDFGSLAWIQEANENNEYALIYVYPGLNLPGSCYFNGRGSSYWRLPPDTEWTFEDQFSVDLRFWQPENIKSIKFRMGRDPRCNYEFTVTGTLTEEWSTHTWYFKDGIRLIRGIEALQEPSYTIHDEEYYEIRYLPYEPLPFINTGYLEMTVSGTGASDVYFKNFKNVRTRFVNNSLFLGLNESLYIPTLDLFNTGTIEFDYYPSEAAVNLVEGDPRDFIYIVTTVSTDEAGISVVLHPYWGWNVYCHTPEEKFRATFLPVWSEAQRMLPTRDAPGPFHVILTWSADHIPGRTDQVVLWVDGGEACTQEMTSLGKYFDQADIKLTLGRGPKAFDIEEIGYSYAGYGRFSNLKVYKHAIPTPSADIDNEAVIPENLIELSLDKNNWASFPQGNLPLISQNVQHGDCIKFYMRNKRPRRDIKELHQRHLAYLTAMWEVTQ